jgi:hypothetical protein
LEIFGEHQRGSSDMSDLIEGARLGDKLFIFGEEEESS